MTQRLNLRAFFEKVKKLFYGNCKNKRIKICDGVARQQSGAEGVFKNKELVSLSHITLKSSI